MAFFDQTAEQTLTQLKTDHRTGLSSQEAQKRLSLQGFNELKVRKKVRPFFIFLNQFKSFIILILLGAILINIFLREVVDSVLIFIIVLVVALIGFFNEYRAEKAIEMLQGMTSPTATVMRNGKITRIPTRELVGGDILIIEEGTKILADARLFEVVSLHVSEAALTGESVPIGKKTGPLPPATLLAERTNMVFSGTVVTQGRGKAVVAATGMKTEFGKIASLIEEVNHEQTPLQKKLEHFGKILVYVILAICAIIFFVEAVLLKDILLAFIFAVSLAVAAVPEGLPAAVTIALALGAKKMAKKNALMRKLSSVETLGSVQVICSDKTGTLTRNEMMVVKMFCDDTLIEVSGSGYAPAGKFLISGKEGKTKNTEMLLRIGALCNNASLMKGKNEWEIVGDPTEGALVVSAAKGGIQKSLDEKKYARVHENPFDSSRKLMSTIHNIDGKLYVYVKGAPDKILERCSKIQVGGKIGLFSEKEKEKISGQINAFAKDALRILGFAYKPHKEKESESNLIFVGLQAMIDPPRQEVIEAIQKCKTAHIRPIMITGDHKLTAEAIGNMVGINGKAIDGNEIDAMDDETLERVLRDISIFARVSSEHKLRLITLLKKSGKIIAMTGDGINDAPAMKKADIGIAMGITGTDVTKETSDMILVDDNFASIVNAVEEGRVIYDNILKFIDYLLSGNIAEVLVVFFAAIFGMPLPLIAVQILWLNLVTDGLPAIALSVDTPSKNIMARQPRDPKENLLSKRIFSSIFFTALLITVATLSVFYFNLGEGLEKAQTMAFTTLVAMELMRVQTVRAKYNVKLFSNKYLMGALLLSIGLQASILYTPLNVFFNTVPLGAKDVLLIVLLSVAAYAISFSAIFGKKFFQDRRELHKA